MVLVIIGCWKNKQKASFLVCYAGVAVYGRLLVVCGGLLVVGSRLLVVFGCLLVVCGCLLVVFGCLLVIFSCLLVGFGCLLVVFSRMLVVCDRLLLVCVVCACMWLLPFFVITVKIIIIFFLNLRFGTSKVCYYDRAYVFRSRE